MAKEKTYTAPVTKTGSATPVAERVTPTPTFTTSAPAPKAAALPFGRNNYLLMGVGVLVIIAGFIIMSLDKEEFGFGALGLTIGPIIVTAGFIVEFFAILSRPKQ